MTGRALLAAAFAGGLLIAGCAPQAPPAPALTGMTPDHGLRGEEVEAVLEGQNLRARVKADFNDPARSEVTLPRVWLHREETEHPARVVKLESTSRLTVLVPADLGPGAWDVTLEDGWGRTSTLEDAYRVEGCTLDEHCDDQIPCTIDRCVEGACTAELAPGQCRMEGACVAAGTVSPEDPCRVCDPAADPAAWSPAPDGASCDDKSACTLGDTCQVGTCQAGPPKECPAQTCQVATCDPATGACGVAAAPDGQACDDGYACTANDACQGGVCAGAWSCTQVPPTACLSVSPLAAAPDQVVTFDATCTRDLDEATGSLLFRFDFEGDGTWDTPQAQGGVATHAYPAEGLYPAVVEVTDADGLTAAAVRHVAVASPAGEVVVTTALDEDDPGATVQAPGGTGLSLREAILLVNQDASLQRIRFLPGLQLQAAALPPLTRAGLTVAGEDGVVVDFTGALGTCLTVGAAAVTVVGLELRGCAETAVGVTGAGARLLDVEIASGGEGVRVDGPGARLGPGLRIHDLSGDGLDLRADGAVVEAARIWRCDRGVRAKANNGTARILRSLVYDNAGNGMEVDNQVTLEVLSCTVDGNGQSGIAAGGSSPPITVQSSLLTHNAKHGLDGSASRMGVVSPNGYFGNGAGPLSSGAPDAGDLVQDPLYRSRTAGDFRLSPGSGAIDLGVDGGLDLNGPGPGLYNGAAPDLGALEAP